MEGSQPPALHCLLGVAATAAPDSQRSAGGAGPCLAAYRQPTIPFKVPTMLQRICRWAGADGGGCAGGFLNVGVGCGPKYPSGLTACERSQKEASIFSVSGLTARGLEKSVPDSSSLGWSTMMHNIT